MSEFLFYLLESAACLSLFYGVYWLFLKNETFFALNRFYLVTTLLISFVIPLINLPSPMRTRSLSAAPNVMFYDSAGHASGFGATEILFAVYLLGTAFFVLRFGYQLFALTRLIHRSGVIHRNGSRFVITQENNTPFSFFNLIFLKPSEFEDRYIQNIITHERVHIQQYHSIDVFIMELASALQWFNPFVWPYKKSLKETHEYLADNAVIAQGGDRARYQLLILEQQVGMKLFEFANNFNHSQIKRRITMMTKRKSKKGARFKLVLILPIACFLVLAFAEPRPVMTSSAAIASTSGVNPILFQEKTQSQEELKLEQKREAIKQKMIQIKQKAENTEDENERKELKAVYAKLQAALEENGVGNGDNDTKWIKIKKVTSEGEVKIYRVKQEHMEMIEEMKLKLEKSDDPELQEKIKQKINTLLTEEAEIEADEDAELATESLSEDMIKDDIKKLETLLKETEDPEKRAVINYKLASLKSKLTETKP